MKRFSILAFIWLLVAMPGAAQQTTTTLTRANGFTDYTGSTSYTFQGATHFLREDVTMSLAEFTPSNGPSIRSGDLTFECNGPAVGEQGAWGDLRTLIYCNGPVTAVTGTEYRVVWVWLLNESTLETFGVRFSVDWTLENNSSYRSGTYSATVTFTESQP